METLTQYQALEGHVISLIDELQSGRAPGPVPELARVLAEGDLRLAERDREGARVLFEKGLAMDPGCPLAAAGIAYTEFDLSASIEGLSQLLEAWPQLERPHLYLGYCHVLQSRMQEARREFETCLSLRPDDLVPSLALAAVFVRLGKKSEAAVLARRVSQSVGTNFPMRRTVALILFRCKHYQGAFREARLVARSSGRWVDRLRVATLPIDVSSRRSRLRASGVLAVVVLLNVAQFGRVDVPLWLWLFPLPLLVILQVSLWITGAAYPSGRRLREYRRRQGTHAKNS
jgi:tetratricopeptide (TPR) repeat protein